MERGEGERENKQEQETRQRNRAIEEGREGNPSLYYIPFFFSATTKPRPKERDCRQNVNRNKKLIL